MFVIVTATAMFLSMYLSVGRLLGLTDIEVMQWLENSLFPGLPSLLVWTLGLIMAIRRRKGNRAAASLTMIALIGMALTSVVSDVVEMVLLRFSNHLGITLSCSLTILRYFYGGLETACWILILLAIFTNRPTDASRPQRADPGGNPFLPTSGHLP